MNNISQNVSTYICKAVGKILILHLYVITSQMNKAAPKIRIGHLASGVSLWRYLQASNIIGHVITEIRYKPRNRSASLE